MMQGCSPGVLTSLAVEGRFLQAGDVAALREQAVGADAAGAGAVFVGEGTLGDPVVLLAGLSPAVSRVLLGPRLRLAPGGRHPAMIARELTCLHLVSGGRSILSFTPPFTPPFTEALVEAIVLCRAMWRDGEAASDGPHFPVRAVCRPRPSGTRGPLVALDLTAEGGREPPTSLVRLADYLLRPTDDAAVCRLERT